jgi:uncharacterized membrane protein YcaP (DUF421 family)
MIDWIAISYGEYIGIISTITLIYIALIIIIRLNGLRSFSKISGHDFAITVAIGSIIASTVLAKDPALFQGVLAIAFFLLLQTIVSKLRRGKLSGFFENTPVMLMDGSKILHENLKKAKIKESDLRSKLREANVLDLEEVKAVVLEATGDISVLHGKKNLQSYLLEGVKH